MSSKTSNNTLSYGPNPEAGNTPETQVIAMRRLVVDKAIAHGLNSLIVWEQQQTMRARELEAQRQQVAAQVAIGNSSVQFVSEIPPKTQDVNAAAFEQPASMAQNEFGLAG